MNDSITPNAALASETLVPINKAGARFPSSCRLYHARTLDASWCPQRPIGVDPGRESTVYVGRSHYSIY